MNKLKQSIDDLLMSLSPADKDGWNGELLCTPDNRVKVLDWLAKTRLTQRAADGARYCPACKSLLEEHSVYCDNCGTDTPRR